MCSAAGSISFSFPSENTWSTHSLTANGSVVNHITHSRADSLFGPSRNSWVLVLRYNKHDKKQKHTYSQAYSTQPHTLPTEVSAKHPLHSFRQLWPSWKSLGRRLMAARTCLLRCWAWWFDMERRGEEGRREERRGDNLSFWVSPSDPLSVKTMKVTLRWGPIRARPQTPGGPAALRA